MNQNLSARTEAFLNKLDGVRCSGKGWVAICPCTDHNAQSGDPGDHSPSLSINLGQDQRILLHCQTGCKTERILGALGMSMRDLFNCNLQASSTETDQPDAKPLQATPELYHEVYSQLLTELGLEEGHSVSLQNRGLTIEAIETNEYQSLRNHQKGQAAKSLFNKYGDQIYSVPGFIMGPYGPTLVSGPTGIVIPVRDSQAKIVALKLRTEGTPKYLYLSDSGTASTGSPVHVPVGTPANAPLIRVIEGELKSDICFLKTGIATIGIPGVTRWKSCIDVLFELDSSTVILAPDIDIHQKYPVFQQMQEFYETLKEFGFEIQLEDWHAISTEHKGLDDLLNGGLTPNLLRGEEVDQYFESIESKLLMNHDVQDGLADEYDSSLLQQSNLDQSEIAEFPVEAFPGPVQNYILELTESLGCPVDFVGTAVLTVAAGAIGMSRITEVKSGWTESSCIYAVIIAEPGTMKSPALAKVMGPILDFQSKLVVEYHEAFKAYEKTKNQKLATLIERLNRQNSRENSEAEEPVLKHVYVSNFTLESLNSILASCPRGVILYCDELSAWVAAMNSYRDGADREAFLSIWSNGAIKQDRKTDGSKFIRQAYLSILGGIQPEMLHKLDPSKGLQDGFMDRILLSYPANQPFAEITSNELNQESKEFWYGLIHKLLNYNSDPESFEPKVIKFCPAAFEYFCDYYNSFVKEIDSRQYPQRIKGVAGKMKGYIARFALIIHCLREETQEAQLNSIEVVDVEKAIMLCRYFFEMAIRVHNKQNISLSIHQTCNSVRDWMLRKGRQEISVRDLLRSGVSGVKQTETAKQIIQEMVQRGLGSIIKGEKPRSPDIFRLNA